MLIRDAAETDLNRIVEIFNDAVITSTATFERNPQTIESRGEWFRAHGKTHPLIVATYDGSVIGYCSLSKFQSNCGYSQTAELSIYVHKANRRKGVATELMKDILQRAKRSELHVIISSISSDNAPSIRLHEKFGFEKVAHLRQVGCKFGKWHDTTYYELIL